MSYDPRAWGAKCDECPMGPQGFLRDPTQAWCPVPSEFHPDATVIAVAENPAEEERKAGYPFAGKSGIEWTHWLNQVGRHRHEVSIANIVECMPPGSASGGYERMTVAVANENKRRVLLGLPPVLHPAEACRPRLLKQLEAYKRVIVLGGTATKALFHTAQGIQALRGGAKEIGGRIFMPTLHPAFVLRAQQWRDYAIGDVAKAWRWFENRRNWIEPYYEWKPTPARLREWLAMPARFIVHDYETNSKEPLKAIVDCVGFAMPVEPAEEVICEKCSGSGLRLTTFTPGEGWIPTPADQRLLDCRCCAGKGRRTIVVRTVLVPIVSRQNRSDHFYQPHEEAEIKEIIREHMRSTRMKVGHNIAGYDTQVTDQWLGVRMVNYLDTLPVARSIAPDLPKGLGVVGSKYTDVEAWKADADGKKIAYGAVSDAQLHFYCAPGDCAVNVQIVDPLLKASLDRGYFRPIREDIKPASWARVSRHPWTLQGVDLTRQEMCVEMHYNGMYVDQQRRHEHEQALRVEEWKYRAKAMQYAHSLGLTGKEHKNRIDLFNPGSDKQVATLFFEHWGLTPTKRSEKTGAPSVDDEVLRDIITTEELPPERFMFVDAVRRMKRARKARSTFVFPMQRRDLWQPRLNAKGHVIGKEPICWDDGRVRPSVTAMLNSVARLNMSDGLHQMPGQYRDMFCAQPIFGADDARYPGRVLIGGDVDQFHLRIIANRWKVARLQEAFFYGLDPHSALALDFFGDKFKNADGWGPDGFSLKSKPKKDSPADKMRQMGKVIRYQGAYADTPEGIWRSVKKVEDKKTGDLPFKDVTLRQVNGLYKIWMRAEPEWQRAWQGCMDAYARNGGWIEECVMGRRSGGLEAGKLQAVVNFDILAAEPPIFTLIESNIRDAFPFGHDGPGTGMIHQGHDAANVETTGFAWVENRNGRDVVVCDEKTEKKRKTLEECMNVRLPGWDVTITASAQVGPVRDRDGKPKLSNWKEA